MDWKESERTDWKGKAKLCLWGAVGGAIAVSIIGFGVGGWVRGATAEKMARDMADTAVADSLAPICVAQFLQDPDKDERLEDMKKLELWGRAEFVKNQGWATMPGSDESSYTVADKCARLLAQL